MLSLVVVAVTGLIVIGLLVGSDDDVSDEARPLEPAAGAFVPFSDDALGISMDLAPGWVGTAIGADTAGLGQRAAPNDPELAGAIDAAVAALPRQAVFLAIDGNDRRSVFTSNVNALSVPLVGSETLDDIERQAPSGLRAFGARDVSVERISGAQGEGLRLSFKYAEGGPLAGVSGRQYYFVSGDSAWILTFVSDDIAANDPLFDAMASTFRG